MASLKLMQFLFLLYSTTKSLFSTVGAPEKMVSRLPTNLSRTEYMLCDAEIVAETLLVAL